ncbi:hypothetical protein GGQ88_003116 [Novosphingobium hassiacum]|uniref:DUF4276 family protein n=1 Tax=Novosphingobium hassiacum TaxID=173676 RepID=A0A7W6EX29_9SPHN|nr:hypothetical protein [Novosphingobium hassiacum]MBB3861826.1 hypothetical protein [Novosphingobium hassiacum]
MSWAAMYEGETDRAYFDIIIPLVIEDITRRIGTRNVTVPLSSTAQLGKGGRSIESVAAEICAERDAFHVAFIHADTGGRSLEAKMAGRSYAFKEAAFNLCGFPLDRCVIIAPRHETEAWMLADQEAVGLALGYRGDLSELGLPQSPQEADRLVDPKSILATAVHKVRGRRSTSSVQQIIPAIAQRQRIGILRDSPSFQLFESQLIVALRSLGCVN